MCNLLKTWLSGAEDVFFKKTSSRVQVSREGIAPDQKKGGSI